MADRDVAVIARGILMIAGRRLTQILFAVWVLAVVASQLVVLQTPDLDPRDGARMVQVLKPTMPLGSTGEPPALEVFEYGPADAEHTIVALHGSPTFGEDFRRLAAALGDDCRVIAPVMPGYGASDDRVDDYGVTEQARLALGVMHTLGITRAHLFAHSLGGGTALRMAEFAPDEIASITAYGAIGIQEGEGSGDYDFEHFKYSVGHLLVVNLVELIPHFGALPDRGWRRAWLRNFTDTDQRPLRRTLENLETPLLILHGVDDQLVPVATARAHHQIVEHSSLEVFDASHFMVFDDEKAAVLADRTRRFVEAVDDGTTIERSTIDPFEPSSGSTELPGGLELGRGQSLWLQSGIIILATFVLEDPTSIAVGFAIREQLVDPFVGIFATVLGIFLGDLGLYFLGFLAARTRFGRKFVAGRVGEERLARLGSWFDQKGWQAIVACRFLPGTRLPVYLAAGWTGKKPLRFGLWTLMAGVVWTPALVIGTAIWGDGLFDFLTGIFGTNLLGQLLAGLTAIVTIALSIRVVIWLITQLSTRRGRLHLRAKFGRLCRWEYWPSKALYYPLIPFFARIRFTKGGIRNASSVNPVWPDGGFIGESKQKVLDRFPKEAVLESFFIEPNADGRYDEEWILKEIEDRQLGWPLIIKPDQGQRGTGVKKVESPEDLTTRLRDLSVPMIVQKFHPGPYELGLFWWQLPGQEKGRLFSICEKLFPKVEGDGKHTLEELILRDRRLFLQHEVFFERFEDRLNEVPETGETVELGTAGNHAQGCQFVEGEHWRTDAIEAWLDRSCVPVEGYCFGRLDVRFTDPEEFKQGRGGKILEANGISSESTNMYDPRYSIFKAWRLLREPWHAILEIGKHNRKQGLSDGVGWFELLGRVKRWRKEGRVSDVAD
ncbi:MAG: alpha/beta fold hydrolase [Planctomycetota bacterium]